MCADLYFQDNRLWLQYGGNWGAAGNADLCPADYNGKAYVEEQLWDISGLQACQPGSTCPVSKTFTDGTTNLLPLMRLEHPAGLRCVSSRVDARGWCAEHFSVPTGCGSISVDIIKNSARGQVTANPPTPGNGWRGEILMSDPCKMLTPSRFVALSVSLTLKASRF